MLCSAPSPLSCQQYARPTTTQSTPAHKPRLPWESNHTALYTRPAAGKRRNQQAPGERNPFQQGLVEEVSSNKDLLIEPRPVEGDESLRTLKEDSRTEQCCTVLYCSAQP